MAKRHKPEWFLKQEARLQEPINNTVRYYTRRDVAFMLSLLYCPPVGVLYLFWFGLHSFLKTRKYIRNFSNLTTDFMNNGRAVTNDGAPGSGKTFTGSNVAYFLALEQWEKLKSDYFTQCTMVAQWVRTGETDKLEAFKYLEESYLFYAEREAEYIPCLVSSVPLREYGTGRMSYQITADMFLQKDKEKEKTVFFNDEIGENQGVDKSMTNNAEYLAFWRYPRHFFDGMFVNTNQDGGQAAIQVRRSTDYVNRLLGQTWVKKPERLERRFEKRKKRYLKRLEKGKLSESRAEYIGQELYYDYKYYHTIGFRAVKHQLMTVKGVAVGEVEEIILPAIGGVQYDERAYINQYKCRSKHIAMQGWDKLTIDPYDNSEFDNEVRGNVKV